MKGRWRDLPGRGRFAPSPTGELHFGSIVAAVASFLDARSRGDEWLVRIDDIDARRVAPGASAAIVHELERLGLHWDGDIVHQSARTDLYAAALEALQCGGHCFPCACTRREVGGRVYPGTCRHGVPAGKTARSVRVRGGRRIDRDRGPRAGTLPAGPRSGYRDFLVYRADGVFAYHLATAFDDTEQGITHVVRGADLLISTLPQVYLQDLLSRRRPEYAHVPVATNRKGEKLGKRTRAPPTRLRPASLVAWDALRFLAHSPPTELVGAPPEELWSWAIGEWDLARVPRVAARMTTRSGNE